MALSGRTRALHQARAGAGYFGSMRAGYCPIDLDPTDDTKPMWKESFVSGNRPATTTWTVKRE